MRKVIPRSFRLTRSRRRGRYFSLAQRLRGSWFFRTLRGDRGYWHLRFLVLVCFFAARAGTAAELQKPMPVVPRGELGRYVNPFIGTGGISYLCGNTFPGATTPFAMVRLSPDTVSRFGKRASNSSGYYYADSHLLGFSHTRLVGTGATDGGSFMVVPTYESSVAKHRGGLLATLDHGNETAFPGYYGVALGDVGVTAELTATCRAGVHRYTFHRDEPPHLLIDVCSALGKGKCRNGHVRISHEKNEIEGSVQPGGLDGNDDGGTLSAWYVFSSLGLYPVAGTDRYELGSPLWTRAEVRLQDKVLQIIANENSIDRPYVKQIYLNEKLLDRHWLRHDEIVQVGILRFEMQGK